MVNLLEQNILDPIVIQMRSCINTVNTCYYCVFLNICDLLTKKKQPIEKSDNLF